MENSRHSHDSIKVFDVKKMKWAEIRQSDSSMPTNINIEKTVPMVRITNEDISPISPIPGGILKESAKARSPGAINLSMVEQPLVA